MSADHLQDLQWKRASRSMHSQFFFFCCFPGCFSVSFSVSFSLRSWAGPRRSWSPTWPQLEPMLEPCWPLFVTLLGVLLASQLKIAFKMIFCCFLIAFRSSRSSKTLPLSMISRIVAFASWSFLRPMLDRFWIDFGFQNRAKIGPKRVPNGVGNHCRFCMPSGTSKNRFFGQHGPNLAPKMAPSWSQDGTKIGPKRVSEAASETRSILDPSWDHLGTHFGPFFVKKYKTLCVLISLCSEIVKTHHVFTFFVVRFSHFSWWKC